MYSGTRFSIARQLAPMQIGIRNTDSMMRTSAIPSMPRFQPIMPAIGWRSTNCH